MMWVRLRFEANLDDYRCVKWPPPGPYWCSGETFEVAFVIAYIPVSNESSCPLADAKKIVLEYWPEANDIEESGRQCVDAPTFSERFPCPDWWDANECKFIGRLDY